MNVFTDTEAHVCEQLGQSLYIKVSQLGVDCKSSALLHGGVMTTMQYL